jgi:two-component system phosphate regulon sensor histidine kinase PhoR
LGNAAKYTSESGHASLEIELGDNEISFLVEDAGIGIAEDELPHVFDTFFRSDDVRVQQISGNGLGLAFAQEVARLHGGRLTVHSELGKGSLFTFTLPRA